MRLQSLAGATAGLAFIAVTLPGAAAALTPEEAWQTWQELTEDMGVALTSGGETESGDTLTVSSVAYAMDTDEGMTITGSIGDIAFAGQSDGSVEVTLPDSYPITLSGTSSDGTPASAEITVSHPDLDVVMSDMPDGGVAYDYSAPIVEIALVSATEDGEPQDIDASATLADVSGRSARTGGDVPEIEGRFEAARATAAIGGTDPENGGTFSFDMAIADVVSESSGTLTTIFGVGEDLGTMIERGFSSTGTGSTGEVTFSLSGEAPSDGGGMQAFSASGRMGGTTGTGQVDAETLAYDVSYNDISFTASGSQIPFPQVTGALGELRTRLAMPTTPGEEAGPMAFTVALRDLTVGDEIWSLFDPAGMLPRDPASLVVDLSGQIRLLADIFSEEAAESEEMPAEVEELAIEEMRLAIAGAELTGEGGFTFDYDAPGPFGPGTPAPDGRILLRLEGAQRLLETLVQMGLVPEEQAMMARMMTGMLARPAPEGGDALVSEIVVQPDGTILANGAPLPF